MSKGGDAGQAVATAATSSGGGGGKADQIARINFLWTGAHMYATVDPNLSRELLYVRRKHGISFGSLCPSCKFEHARDLGFPRKS